MEDNQTSMPQLSSCRKCKRIFSSTGEALCPDCLKEEEVLLVRVKEYIYENPEASLDQIAKQMGISEEIILKFVRDERVELNPNEDVNIRCEICGAKITKGKYCSECKRKLLLDLNLCLKEKNND